MLGNLLGLCLQLAEFKLRIRIYKLQREFSEASEDSADERTETYADLGMVTKATPAGRWL